MRIKTTMKHHLTPIRMAIINKLKNDKFGKDAEKSEPSYIGGEFANWYSRYRKQSGGSSKN